MSFDLRTARLNAGHSQRSLSRASGAPVAAIRRLEAHAGGVAPATAVKLGAFFNVPPSTFPSFGEREEVPA